MHAHLQFNRGEKMDKRYQVFISSTYSDLKDERKQIIESLLNAKYIPAGMELFSASNDEQFKYIKKIIDNCDYYILIVAGRYGSINPNSGLSFTEQEYNYAIEREIPVLSFIHSNPEGLPSDKKDSVHWTQLQTFIEKVKTNQKMGKMWTNIAELIAAVLNSVNEYSTDHPALGWVRGATYDNTELLEQINHLRIDSVKSKEEIERLENEIYVENQNKQLSAGPEKYAIKGKITKRDSNGRSIKVDHTMNLSWDDIFSSVGPYLYSTCAYYIFEIKLRTAVNSYAKDSFTQLNSDVMQTIKIQLLALNLINVYQGLLATGEATELIELTETGRNYLLKIKSIKKITED